MVQRFTTGGAFTIACAVTLMMAISLRHVSAEAGQRTFKIVALGDSLTAGYGLPVDAAFPVRLEQALKAQGYSVDIANAGVSGDTTSDGLARLDWSVPDGTDAVILELGANDALRGIDPTITKAAIDASLHRLKERHIAVLLAGMLAPRNMGSDYDQTFDKIFPDLATKYGLAYYPFFMDGVATQPLLLQADGLHPTGAGVDVIVMKMLPTVKNFLAHLP